LNEGRGGEKRDQQPVDRLWTNMVGMRGEREEREKKGTLI